MSTTPSVNMVSTPTQQIADQTNVQSGVILPCDIRVRLVRAESAGLDTILSLLYSSMFSVFGVFLGIVITKNTTATTPEIAATWFFGTFSVLLLGWWIYTKVRQYEKGISLPSSILQGYENK